MMHKIVALVKFIQKQHKKHNVFLHFNIAKTFVSVFCGYVISRHEKRITIDIEIFIAVWKLHLELSGCMHRNIIICMKVAFNRSRKHKNVYSKKISFLKFEMLQHHHHCTWLQQVLCCFWFSGRIKKGRGHTSKTQLWFHVKNILHPKPILIVALKHKYRKKERIKSIKNSETKSTSERRQKN